MLDTVCLAELEGTMAPSAAFGTLVSVATGPRFPSRIASTIPGREQREPQDADHAGRFDTLALGESGDGGELFAFEHPLPADGWPAP